MANKEIIRISPEQEKIWEQIKKQIEAVEYGTITITIHDSRITQIETSTKQRF